MRPHISAHPVANEVRMLRTQHKGTLLIVEGACDSRTFRNLVDDDACRIVISHGKENAIVAMQILGADAFHGVLAIIDADFNRLDNASLCLGNTLITDLHDLECMMIASPAFHKLVSEFADPARIHKYENDAGYMLAEALARNAMPLGYLRWLSLRQELNLRFEELAFHKFVEPASLKIDVDRLIEVIKDHSQRHDISTSTLKQEIAAMTNPRHDPWQVCCGHDLLEMLSLALRYTVAGRSAHEVKREILERELRLAYQGTYFQRSKLARAIRDWEDSNRPYRILLNP